MKLAVVILSIFVAQTSASFYDFKKAFGSVQDSLDKLMSDVVSDVKVTIDCTILAVEEALSLNGMFGDHSHYNKYCKAQSADIITQNAVRDAREMTKDFSHHIEESVAEMNKTIESLLDKHAPVNNQFHIDIQQIGDNETKNETVDDFPKNFRTVVKKIVNDDNPEAPGEIKLIDATTENNTEALSSRKLPHVEKNQNKSETGDLDLSEKLFASKDTAHDKAVRETEKFIKRSQYTGMLMNNFLNANQGAAVNVFDNPELLLG